MALCLQDKVVLITGASSGIGKACAKTFAALGAKLILTARRLDRLTALAEELSAAHGVAVLPMALDVQDKDAVANAINSLAPEWAEIDVLINNAGLALDTTKLHEGNIDNWDTMLNTNVHGLLYMSRAVLPGMVARNRGHVINVGSVAGHDTYPNGNVYCATKHAVSALSKAMRLDLFDKAVRVSEVAPGAVHTEFSEVRWQDKARADAYYEGFEPLMAEDVADAIAYCATRPAHVDVSELVLFPTAQTSCHYLAKHT